MFVNESVADAVDTVVRPFSAYKYKGGVMLDMLNDKNSGITLENGGFRLCLAPYQSVIVVLDSDADAYASLPGAPEYEYCDAELLFYAETADYTDMSKYATQNEDADRAENIRIRPDFSGKIRYTCTFDRPDNVCAVDFGEVGQTLHLWCNGADLGVRVCPPYSYDLSDVLKEKDNEIVACVSTTLANAIRDGFSSFMAIPASGIRGPVRFGKIKK